jgi:hypothetical protein
VGGAIPEQDYLRTVSKAGFNSVQIVAQHTLAPEELEAMACCPGRDFTHSPSQEDLAAVQGKVKSIKFTAFK